MSAITRYILTEFVKVLSATTAVVTLFVWIFFVAERMRQSGLCAESMCAVMPYFLPYALKISLQASLLFATCLVYGRMSASNELLALKSMGVSPLRAVLPALGIASALAVAVPLLDDLHSSWCCRRIQKTMLDYTESITLGRLRDDGAFVAKGYSVGADRVVGNRLYGVRLNIAGEAGEDCCRVSAEEGFFSRAEDDSAWSITLVNGTIDADHYRVAFHNPEAFSLPLKPGKSEAFQLSKVNEQRAVVDSIFHLSRATKDLEELLRLRAQYDDAFDRLRYYETQFMHKWANGFSCLGFVMLGAPVAMLMRSSGYLSSFFVCFLPVLLIYQPLHKFPTVYAESGVLPTVSVWVATALLVLVGGLLLRFVNRR